jgi:hypothetical protein
MYKPCYFVSLHYIYFKYPLGTCHGYLGVHGPQAGNHCSKIAITQRWKILLGLHSQT